MRLSEFGREFDRPPEFRPRFVDGKAITVFAYGNGSYSITYTKNANGTITTNHTGTGSHTVTADGACTGAFRVQAEHCVAATSGEVVLQQVGPPQPPTLHPGIRQLVPPVVH